MANPIWITGQGQRLVDLGTVTEGAYFEYPLDAYDPNSGPVTYKFLAGVLPPGIRINVTGMIQGGPYLNTAANETSTYEFTVRATDQNGLISDKSFTMTVANVNPPVIIPRVTDLGEVFDGEFYNLQLAANELNPNAVLTWSLSAGELPGGLSLSTSGLISGFILPLTTTDATTIVDAPDIIKGTVYTIQSLGSTNFVSLGAASNTAGIQFTATRDGVSTDGTGTAALLFGFNTDPYNEFAYENSATYRPSVYKFTIKVFDGTNYDSLTYQISVIAKGYYTADNSVNTIDDTYLTIDQDNKYVPIMITESQALPEVRSNSKFAFQFQAIDPNNNELRYNISLSSSGAAGFDQDGTQGFDTTGFDQENLSLPPGLVLDPSTGWLSGTVGAQVEAVQTYTFQVYAYELSYPTVQSTAVTYTMTVLGDITNTITWLTSSDLGTMDNGAISELSVSAVNIAGRELTYSLVGDNSRLPQGLQVQNSGLIVGRAGFEFFTLDGGTTTIDGVVSGFDNVYSFIIQATNVDGTASSQKTFTITINNFNAKPYEDVYIKALPTLDQRNIFLDIVNNTDIFPEELIYRSSDPNFGRARDIRSLFLAGLNPTQVSDYLAAMTTNTYNKRIEFGNVKTAIAVDANFNTKYEVVYIQLDDDATYNGASPANSRYDSIIGRTVYPNSFENMSSVITDATGVANPGAIPGWMTSPQSDKKQLGFTRAIVLAYTVPGASKLIAYRLAANGIEFNSINFVLDRYDLDNSYSSNYNIDTADYDLGTETTFDRIVRPGVITTSVEYGVSGLAFNMINNKTVAQINALGGLDGVTTYATGDKLVFLQQENYIGETGAYDGWTNPDLIPGWVEFTNSEKIPDGTAGYPTSPTLGQVALVDDVYYMFTADYDVNGNIVDTVWKVANLRANVWTINIDSSNVVTLTATPFLRNLGSGTSISQITSMIVAGDRVQINHGHTHSDSVVYYNPVLAPGNSVPAYTLIPTLLTVPDSVTRFDNYGTRFINNRISYENPETGDVWLKFADTGPLL